MTQFHLFDSIKLKEPITLEGGAIASEGTLGSIVEVLDPGKAYLVELFGAWVTAGVGQDFVLSDRNNPQSFMETIGVEIVDSHQMYLVKPAREVVGVRAELLALMDELPEVKLAAVRDFAESLKST